MILGAVPPPIGGVTVHTLRLISRLESIEYKHEFVNLRPRTGKGKFNIKEYTFNTFKILKSRNIEVIHYQLNNIYELALVKAISMIIRSRIITTVHSFRPKLFSRIKRLVFCLIRKTKVEFIAPSETIKDALITEGVEGKNIRVLNTFLPPSEYEINAELSNEIMEFISKRGMIIVSNASTLYRDGLGIDVYGLDMCIEACKAITNINFVFCLPQIRDLEYYNECIKKIKEYRIEDRFLLVNEDVSLVSLFKYTDLFVRPTSTDSFGISVAEALAMGVPAVASDVCERAEGTIIFENRNLDCFIDKIISVSKCEHKPAKNNNSSRILDTYLHIYNG